MLIFQCMIINVLYVLDLYVLDLESMFGDPWWYTRCFVMLLMKPGELCGKQVLKVRQQLILCTLSLQQTHFSDNYPSFTSFTSRDSSILQEQSTIQRFAGDYPGGPRNQVIAGIRLFPRRMSRPNYLETGKIVVGCKKNIWGALRALAKFIWTFRLATTSTEILVHRRHESRLTTHEITSIVWLSLILVQIFQITENSMNLWTA